jgi:small subunit ribosomal protein S18
VFNSNRNSRDSRDDRDRGGLGRGRVRRNEPQRRKRNPLRDIEYVDYTNTKLLGRFINDQGKILPKRITGVTAKQQRAVTKAIKFARHLALMPFVADDSR